MSDSISPFEPHPLVRGGVLQTIIGAQFAGNTDLPSRTSHQLQVGLHSVLTLFELGSADDRKPLVLLAHGMGGCSESGYMRRIAGKLWARGCGVFMMNHRGSGPGMGMSDTLWNGGSSGDLGKVIEYIAGIRSGRPLMLVGFSLSGNILLKYLGEGREVPSTVAGALAVNPPVDLKTASLLLSRKQRNRIFNGYYMLLLNRQAAALARGFPDAFHPPRGLKSIWDFDAAYTAPAAGYKDAAEYYRECSANRFLRNIKLPTTILCSRDDPFIPPAVFENLSMSKSVNYIAPDHGGHMGYISRNKIPDRRWMDYFVVNWVKGMVT